MQGRIQAVLLVLSGHLDRGDLVDQPQHGIGNREGVDRGDRHRRQFLEEEAGVSQQQAVDARRVHGQVRPQAETYDSQEASHPVDAPHVQGIVQVQFCFQGNGQVADDPSQAADDDRAGGGDVACGRGNGRQARHGACQQPDEFGLLLEDPGHDQPDDARKRGGDVGIEEGRGGNAVHFQLAAGVETVPAEP